MKLGNKLMITPNDQTRHVIQVSGHQTLEELSKFESKMQFSQKRKQLSIHTRSSIGFSSSSDDPFTGCGQHSGSEACKKRTRHSNKMSMDKEKSIFQSYNTVSTNAQPHIHLNAPSQ